MTTNRAGKARNAGGSLTSLLRRSRYEVIPIPGVEEEILAHVPKDVKLTVTASPTKGIGATLEFAEHLSRLGYEVAPHLSARLVRDDEHLEDILGRLRGAGIRDVFVVAGDAAEPAGKFEGAVELLEAMTTLGHGLDEVGITGYPESHPLISDEVTIQAMHDKATHATYIVSQICFDPEVTAGWVRRVRQRGVGLPIYIGLPGAVSMVKLMRISGKIGLGDSARFLKKYGNWFARMFAPGGYSPERLISGLTPTFTDPDSRIQGLHIYTFNEVEQTETWRQKKLADAS